MRLFFTRKSPPPVTTSPRSLHFYSHPSPLRGTKPHPYPHPNSLISPHTHHLPHFPTTHTSSPPPTRCPDSSEHKLEKDPGIYLCLSLSCCLPCHAELWNSVSQPVYTGKSEVSRSLGLVWDPQTVALLVISVSSGEGWACGERAVRVQTRDKQQSPHGRLGGSQVEAL